jgi:hypothetical protein
MKQKFEELTEKPAAKGSLAPTSEAQPSQNQAIEKLREIVRIRRNRWRLFMCVLSMSTGVVITLVSVIAAGMNLSHNAETVVRALAAGLVSGLMGLILTVGIKEHAKSMQELLDTTDPAAIGPLAEALNIKEFQWKGTQHSIEGTLIRLLAQLKTGDKLSLSDEEARALYSQLEGKRTKLAIAILQSLTVVPDTMALRYVEDLSRGYGAARSSTEVRKLAHALLLPLRELCHIEDTHATLLRAADSQPAEGTLLRPASDGSQPDSSALLRPTFAEEPPGNSPLVTLPEPGHHVSVDNSHL